MRHAAPWSVGTITLDSRTRLGLFEEAFEALRTGLPLNGYPIVAHGVDRTAELLRGVLGPDFPVQVRHGSPRPERIFKVCAAAGLDAIEGGPISYCLPYGRVPLREAIPAWRRAAAFWAGIGSESAPSTLESFAGCMMGQLCPPSLLVALGILEGLFLHDTGVRNISLSFAQGTNHDQDAGGMRALSRLASEMLGDTTHDVVLYTYMGLFPETPRGARHLIEDSARLAVDGGAARIIVKTAEESRQIPSIEDNVRALGWVDRAACDYAAELNEASVMHEESIYSEASAIIAATLDLSADLDVAMARAFERGLLDVPFCIHPDNRNLTRAQIRADGVIEWVDVGGLPIPARSFARRLDASSDGLLKALSFVRAKYDR